VLGSAIGEGAGMGRWVATGAASSATPRSGSLAVSYIRHKTSDID